MQKTSFQLLSPLPTVSESQPQGIHLPVSREGGVELLSFRSRLDDFCFRYFHPIEFRRTKRISDSIMNDTGMEVSQIIAAVDQVLKEENIGVLGIHGRAKGIHSTYRKLRKYDMDITRVYDLIAVRVLVDDIDSCYQALNALHKKYKPVNGRVKDYIVRPKYNGYQSLHTTVIAPEKGVFEVQFRTRGMHADAEFGCAAHWLYDLVRKRQMRSFFPADRKVHAAVEAHFLQQQKKVLQHAPVEEGGIFYSLRPREYSFLD